MTFDREKFKRLVHYVVWRAGKRDWFGAIKLNKVLWFSDTQAFATTGKPITGAKYIREKWGPVPKAIMPIKAELAREGAIRSWRQGKTEKTTAEQGPDMSPFDHTEMAIIEYWIGHIATYETAGSISERSHDYTWQIAEMGEELPMVATFATRIQEPTDDEVRWGKEIARKLGLP